MSEVHAFLIAFAQALAKMSLYAPGHPSRTRAADTAFSSLRALLVVSRETTFSFLGDDVIHGTTPLRELQGWDWARKLSAAGIQRLELSGDITPEEWRSFLADLVTRLGRVRAGEMPAREAALNGEVGGIRYGGVGVQMGESHESGADRGGEGDGALTPDLSAEANAVTWVHDCVAAGGDIPLIEADLVVQSLAASMHAGQRILLPLLQLKEFDQYTTTHALNVSVLAMALAERLGLSGREVTQYGMAGLLHDLGKVKVPVEVLRKPGVLTTEELAIMRRHPVDGARLIMARDHRLDLCATVAFEHHIMIDGGGYPVRQRRCDCHAASMLVHVCDVYDALRTNRPYRVAWETEAVLQYIGGRIGQEFEPVVARSFIGMITELEPCEARADSLEEQAAAIA